MSSILLVTGGVGFARQVFEGERRGYWSQALPLVLEKYGYLGVATAGPEALEDERTWQANAAVLVARMPEGAWSGRALERMRGGRAQALIELPPPQLEEMLGVSGSAADAAGAVSPVDEELRARVGELTPVLSTRLQPPQVRPVERSPETDWQRLDVPIDGGQAEAWRALGWDVRRWEAASRDGVLAEWVDTEQSGDRWPAIVRRDNVVGCCFSLFAFLGQGATIAPFDGAQHLNWHRPLALEATLIALIDDMHRRAGAVRARVLPWPMGVDWVLNVRHDYDRELTRPRLEAVLDAHARAGTAATWYWRARHVNQTSGPQGGVGRSGPRLVSRRAGHEVALHTDKLWAGAEREQAAVESAAGRKVDGTSAHGDPSCFRWQGAPNVMWAEHRELSYTEFISHAHMHLHRFAALGGDGTLHASAVLCLPHHESFDRSMNPGDTAAEAIAKVAANYARTGGFMQILNHPDINVDELFDTIARLPTAGRLDWTAREAADWWRRTHVADELQVTAIDEHRVRLSSRRGARGLVVELAAPDGTTKRFVLHLEPGDPVELAMPGAPAPAPSRSSSWSASGAPRFAQAVRDYYTARGQPVSADALKTTVDTNSKLVPGRVSTLLKLLGELTDRERLKDARVLEAGCGFGALATYIAQSEEPALVTGIDVREDLVATAREVAARLDLRNLEFRLADMRDLGGIPDSRFDVVIVNNAFVYLRTRRAMREAAAEFARVLAPGGHILMFHANRWQPRDPFTGDPVVHLLGERSARLVGRLTGWHGSHDRLTLLSPRALARILRRAGFELPRAGVVRHGTVKTGRPLLGRYYGIAARRS